MDLGTATQGKKFDFNLALIILSLNLVGLLNLYSAAHGVNTSGMSRVFWQQIVWLGIGWTVYLSVTFINYNFIKSWANYIYGINVLFLLAVIFVGRTSLGAQRWIDLGFFRFQPSETMKVALVLVVAKLLTSRIRPEGMGVRDLILPLIIVFVPFSITVIQPDLGTSLLYVAVVGTILFFVKIKKSVVVTVFLTVALSLPIVWKFGLKEYQKNRVLTFLSPGRDPRGTGYNSIQSKIAVGSGQIFGKGFKKGTQSQLEFLPERHTDFIFSVLSEEHGFVGSLTTVLLFGVLFVIGIRIAQNTKDPYACITVVGLLSILFWHFFINIAMVMGLLPIVGVPLPLISYGGSSLLTTMASLGLISSISYNRSLFQ
jgi:rod shape determining protein RodA